MDGSGKEDDDTQASMLAVLARTLAADEGECEIRHTHISSLLFTRERVYKFRRAVRLPFLDFSTLERRRADCERELRLNRAFSPELYIEVAPIGGSPSAPRLHGSGPAIEYAVVMHRFDESSQLDRVLGRGDLTEESIEAFGCGLARLHARAEVAAGKQHFGDPGLVRRQVLDTLTHHDDPRRVADVRVSLESLLGRLGAALHERKRGGHVRACHGDLHLGNSLLLDGEVRFFDCLEFDDELRMIDTCSDLAFAIMDLDHAGHSQLANRLLDAYLDESGDYGTLSVLSLYCAYRALVRAGVAETQRRDAPTATAQERRDGYLALARAYLDDGGRPGLVITHGVSGSGKSTHCRALARRRGFVHLRSDRERRRLAGRMDDGFRPAQPGQGVYGPQFGEATYARLLHLAGRALEAGYSTVVDATFLDPHWRRRFQALAARHGIGFRILHCVAPDEELRRRILARQREGRDPSEATLAVLDAQLARPHDLEPREQAFTLNADTLDIAGASAQALAHLGRARIEAV